MCRRIHSTLDFPHLMLRHRAAEGAQERRRLRREPAGRDGPQRQPRQPFAAVSPTGRPTKRNKLTRPLMERVAGIDHGARLPKFQRRDVRDPRSARSRRRSITAAPAFGKRKAALYATCFVNYNKPDTGVAARAVLAINGVETEVVYPGCCGMPYWSRATRRAWRRRARRSRHELVPLIDEGLRHRRADAVLRADAEVRMAADPARERRREAPVAGDLRHLRICRRHRQEARPGRRPRAARRRVTVHLACHARAQNMGAKAAEMLRLIPETPVDVIERCSGHGGIWGARTRISRSR